VTNRFGGSLSHQKEDGLPYTHRFDARSFKTHGRYSFNG
jgi:hypothetical protein